MAVQSSLFSVLPDSTPLDPAIVLWGDPRWDAAIAELEEAQVIGFDLETFGPNPEDGLNPWKGEIRLIGAGLPSGLSLVADLGAAHEDRRARAERYGPFLGLLGRKVRSVLVVGMELKFDSLWARVKYGWVIPQVRDIRLMSQVLWAGVGVKTDPRLSHGLKAIAERCGVTTSKEEQREDWGGKITARHLNYYHRDLHVPMACAKFLVQRLKAEGCLYSAIVECEAVCTFTEEEFYGQPVRKDKLDSAAAAYRAAWEAAIKPFSDAFPGINPASQKQVLGLLQDLYPDRGIEKADDAILAALKDPRFDALAEHRALKTQVSYLENLQTYWTPSPEWEPCGCDGAAPLWGVVRTHYSQIAGGGKNSDEAGAGMGRSSSGPPVNWQNSGKLQPKWAAQGLPPVRAVVCPPPGYSYLVADLSQAHARIAAKVSLDPYLMKAYVEDYDVHSEFAAELMKFRGLTWTAKEIKSWSKDKKHANHRQAKAARDAAKNCYYGSQNLQSPETLMTTCSSAPEPVFLTRDEAKFLIDLWRKKYAGLYAFQRKTISDANRHSYTFPELGIPGTYGKVTGPTGRRLYLEKLLSQYTGRTEVKGTDCVSFVWMGAEADIIKRAAAEIFRDRLPAWDLRFVNMAHDELDFIVKTEHVEAASALVLEKIHLCMGHVLSPQIPVDEKGASPAGLVVDDWSKK